MKIVAVAQSLQRVLQDEVRAGEKAVTRAIRVETERLRQIVRAQTRAAFRERSRQLVNAWRAKVYPPGGDSLRAAGVVWTKAPTIIDAFDRGVVIRAKGGRFLAIPTGFNAPQGRRGRGMRVTPQQMIESGQAFLRPIKGGNGFVWCLPVRRDQSSRRGGLIAGGLVKVATAKRKGARGWQQALLAQGFVPMFILLPQVKLAKRLDVRAAGRQALQELPTAIAREWRATGV